MKRDAKTCMFFCPMSSNHRAMLQYEIAWMGCLAAHVAPRKENLNNFLIVLLWSDRGGSNMLRSVKYKIFMALNYILCGVARAAIHLLPLRYLSPYFGRFERTLVISTRVTQRQLGQAIRIGQSVRLSAKYTPWDSSCLTQAMVAKFWCRLFKIPYVFYIGFAKAADEPSGYKAHAWITAGRISITGGNGLMDYNVIASYVYWPG